MKTLTDTINEALNEARIGVRASVGKLKNFDGRSLAIMTDLCDGCNVDIETNDGNFVPDDQVEVVKNWINKNCQIEVLDWDIDDDEEMADPDVFFKKTKLKKTSPFIFWTCKPYPGYASMDEDHAFILRIKKPQSGANDVTMKEIIDILRLDSESVNIVVDNILKPFTYISHI